MRFLLHFLHKERRDYYSTNKMMTTSFSTTATRYDNKCAMMGLRRKNSTRASSSSSSSSSSLVPETLKEMASDPEFQNTSTRLKAFGQKALTREEAKKRRRALENVGVNESFASYIETNKGSALERQLPPSILQVNIGIYCNQACSHCHVESSPLRVEETMSRETR